MHYCNLNKIVLQLCNTWCRKLTGQKFFPLQSGKERKKTNEDKLTSKNYCNKFDAEEKIFFHVKSLRTFRLCDEEGVWNL